jgi:hypothetical protein
VPVNVRIEFSRSVILLQRSFPAGPSYKHECATNGKFGARAISLVKSQVTVGDILLRVVVGGLAVSAFALFGDLLRPKSFAGLLSAAPSVAIATLILTVMKEGRQFASIEGRSMILGAVAFICYETVVIQLLIHRKYRVLPVTSAAMVVGLVCAFGLWFALMRIGG